MKKMTVHTMLAIAAAFIMTSATTAMATGMISIFGHNIGNSATHQIHRATHTPAAMAHNAPDVNAVRANAVAARAIAVRANAARANAARVNAARANAARVNAARANAARVNAARANANRARIASAQAQSHRRHH